MPANRSIYAARVQITRRSAGRSLLKRVRTVHASSRQTYGAPRVHAELQARAEHHGRKRIARLMREAGWVGASHRHGGPVTTRRDKEARPAPDVVDRKFTAPEPNQLWVADITYVPTAAYCRLRRIHAQTSGGLDAKRITPSRTLRKLRTATAHGLPPAPSAAQSGSPARNRTGAAEVVPAVPPSPHPRPPPSGAAVHQEPELPPR